MNEYTRCSPFGPFTSTCANNLRCEHFDNRVSQLSNQVAYSPRPTEAPGGKDSLDVNTACKQLGGANVVGKGVLNWGWGELRSARHERRCTRLTAFIGISLAHGGAPKVPDSLDKIVLRATFSRLFNWGWELVRKSIARRKPNGESN